ncbi:MAG: purine-nucleoside phosphorylase [Acidobacteria bacterium]|nr:purine-nucleoside phosphorylase [Acidobacteriota bacterium]
MTQSSSTLHDRVHEAADFLRARLGEAPRTAVVLGSGLGDFADGLGEATLLRYEDIPHWPASAVVGHAGRLVSGRSAGHSVLALAGRVHFYEGHAMETVTFGVRVLATLGVRTLVLTNAAGGINTAFGEGTLMAIDDHINLMGTNPLVGANDDRFGTRFPDMTEAYSKRLRRLADDVAAARGIELAHGIYAAVHGPSYETPAEIRYLRTIGADAVGMSTAPETIVARHMGLEVLGISCITNMAAGVLDRPLVHDEVMETARRVRASFIGLLEGVIAREAA